MTIIDDFLMLLMVIINLWYFDSDVLQNNWICPYLTILISQYQKYTLQSLSAHYTNKLRK